MNIGGKSPKNEWDIERENIPYANKLYKKWGWEYYRPNEITHDVVIIGKNGKKLPTEEKFRVGIWDDILIEIVQDMRGLGGDISKALGWFYTERMVLFHYFMGCETGKGPKFLYRFDWSKVKPWIWKRLEDTSFHKFQTSNEGYGLTLNLVVPIEDIPYKSECEVLRYD